MKQNQYVNVFRESHVKLLEFLTGELKDAKVTTVGYGNNTQHLFVEGKYMMSINWQLV